MIEFLTPELVYEGIGQRGKLSRIENGKVKVGEGRRYKDCHIQTWALAQCARLSLGFFRRKMKLSTRSKCSVLVFNATFIVDILSLN